MAFLPACLLVMGFATTAAPGFGADDFLFQDIGPGHTSVHPSSPYPDGGRVFWTCGETLVAKIDAATFDVIATLRRPDASPDDGFRHERLIALLDSDRSWAEKLRAAAVEGFKPASPRGSVLDADHRLLVPEGRAITAYADTEPGVRLSGIRVAQRFTLPASIPGRIGRLGLTRDGHVVAATSAGRVIVLQRGFSRLATVVLPHAPKKEPGGGFVRGGPVVDDRDGIFVTSAEHVHRIAWNGSDLSVDEADGGWSEAVPGGFVDGSDPALLGGAGDKERLVLAATGHPPGAIALLWREAPPPGPTLDSAAPAGRIAATQPVGFDVDRARGEAGVAISPVLVTGPGGVLVTAAAAPLPTDPSAARGFGKWRWDPAARTLVPAWTARDLGAVSGLPVLSPDARTVSVVTCRDGRCALEVLDWESGLVQASRPLGGARFLSPGAAPILDPEGRLVTGTLFGLTRIGGRR